VKDESVTEANAKNLIGTVHVLIPSSSFKRRMLWTVPYLNPVVVAFSSPRNVMGILGSILAAACIHVAII
jgi:hypothetical protein